MNFFLNTLRRIAIFFIAVGTIWLISTQVFDRLEDRYSLFTAITATYILAAYFILPLIVHATTTILYRRHIPQQTRAFDGLTSDPINLLFIGTEAQIHQAFMAIGWHQADKTTLRSSLQMIVSLITSRPYLTAPFSHLYLFGKKQNFGYQQSISQSPLERHHIRLWSLHKPLLWAAAGTKDIGLTFSRLTYKITHRVDKNIDEERDYIIQTLQAAGKVTKIEYVNPGQVVGTRYQTDGKIIVVTLWPH